MYIKSLPVCFLVALLFAFTHAEAGEICQNFISGNAKKVDSTFLALCPQWTYLSVFIGNIVDGLWKLNIFM